jgi:hypothetical protein
LKAVENSVDPEVLMLSNSLMLRVVESSATGVLVSARDGMLITGNVLPVVISVTGGNCVGVGFNGRIGGVEVRLDFQWVLEEKVVVRVSRVLPVFVRLALSFELEDRMGCAVGLEFFFCWS